MLRGSAGRLDHRRSLAGLVLLAALSSCGGNNPVQVRVGAAPPVLPAVSIGANPTSISSGGSSPLIWSSTDATSCTASGAWSGSKATSGSEGTGTLAASSSFSITCTGPGGSASATASVVVTGSPPPPVPTVSLTANPISVASGGPSTPALSSTR